METARAEARERDRARWQDVAVTSARPLLRPAPRSAMFFPLVVLVAVLPGLLALNNWDLTPPGPWWGLRGLAVLEGYVIDQAPAAEAIGPAAEASAFRAVAGQPPLYAWLEAAGLALGGRNDPLATVLPSYAAGAAVVVLVYLHGRLWLGAGVGLVAAVLTGFNRHLLVQMQQATPTTLALAGVLGALFCYGEHLRRSSVSSSWAFGVDGFLIWGFLGGVSLGISLMSVGVFGLVALPIVVLHQAYLGAGSERPSARRNDGGTGGPGARIPPWVTSPSLRAGVLVMFVAALVAAPWHVAVFRARGFEALGSLLFPFAPEGLTAGAARPLLLGWMIRLAPATLPLGLYAAFRSVRRALGDDTDSPAVVGSVFWVFWLAVALLVPAFWPTGPLGLCGLFVLIPLNLLAAQAMSDLGFRRLPVRTLIWLAPATAVSTAWWASTNLSGAVDDVFHGRADAGTALGLHLAVDLLVLAVWLTRKLDHWARRRDDRQRQVIVIFLVAVLVVTIYPGGREVWFRHQETDDLLMLRTMILRRDRIRPFTEVTVVGPEGYRPDGGYDGVVPGGRLRFILRSALPNLPQRDLADTDALLSQAEAEADSKADADSQRLVILAGHDQRLPYAVQSRLKLEAIHPGRHGVLDAFATALESQPDRP